LGTADRLEGQTPRGLSLKTVSKLELVSQQVEQMITWRATRTA